MNFIEKNLQIKKLRVLIKNKTQGHSQELAKKMGVSRSTLFRLFKHLEILDGRYISYSKDKSRFVSKKAK